ncbi:MAG: DUF3159 domain-containing protein [Chloroflexi bacterium]|nr:DUF3159 domain-containing protein [Chloroflexota bacterium]
MIASKVRELAEELRAVFGGRSNLADSIVPPLIFVLVQTAAGFTAAMWTALLAALAITVLRLRRGQSLLYALGGFAGVALAIGMVRLLGRAEGYFLPGMVTGLATVMLCLLSITLGRPLVAWTSYIARRWPLGWYWHPLVRPAYSEVTFAWAAFFALRLLLQLSLFQQAAVQLLAVIQLLTGWPATVALLIASYLYGVWRLERLGGPSVEEYQAGTPPPWQSQRRGF